MPIGWGYYGNIPAWYLDVTQKYSSDVSQGQVSLSTITDQNWGVHFNQNQQLSPQSNAYLYFDSPDHKNFVTNMNLNQNLEHMTMSLSLSEIHAYDPTSDSSTNSLSSVLYAQTKPAQIGNGPFQYNLGTSIGQSLGDYQLPVLTQTLTSNLNSGPFQISPGLNLRCSLGLNYLIEDQQNSGLTTTGNAIFNWKLSPNASMNFGYAYLNNSSISSNFYASGLPSPVARQSMTLGLQMTDPKMKWYGSLFAFSGLDSIRQNLFGDFGYRLGRGWRFDITTTFNRFPGSVYQDTQYAIGKSIGNREFMLMYSAQQQQIMFQLGASGF